MKRSAMLVLIAAISALPGCAVTLHGHQTSGGGSTAMTTGSSVQGSSSVGNARIGGSFGALPAQATGGQVTFSRGASAVLVLGLALAGAADLIGEWFKPAPAPREPLAPGGISHTCSCYGWQPELTPQPQSQ